MEFQLQISREFLGFASMFLLEEVQKVLGQFEILK